MLMVWSPLGATGTVVCESRSRCDGRYLRFEDRSRPAVPYRHVGRRSGSPARARVGAAPVAIPVVGGDRRFDM